MLRRPLGRPKNRWDDDIRNDMKKLKIKNWTNCLQDRNNWKLYVEKAKNIQRQVVAPKEEEEDCHDARRFTRWFYSKCRLLCPCCGGL